MRRFSYLLLLCWSFFFDNRIDGLLIPRTSGNANARQRTTSVVSTSVERIFLQGNFLSKRKNNNARACQIIPFSLSPPPLVSHRLLGSDEQDNSISLRLNNNRLASVSPLFSSGRHHHHHHHEEIDDDINGGGGGEGFWKMKKRFLQKLSATLIVASFLFFFSLFGGPANAAFRNNHEGGGGGGGERFFTPEMETSVATLVERADEEVSFWYPEMDEVAAAQQEQQSSPTTASSTTKATIHKNRGGGHYEATTGSSGAVVFGLKDGEKMMSFPLLVINSLLIVTAALLGRHETAESLRKRFSNDHDHQSSGSSINDDDDDDDDDKHDDNNNDDENPSSGLFIKLKKTTSEAFQSKVVPKLLVLQQRWRITAATIEWIVNGGLGLEKATELLCQATAVSGNDFEMKNPHPPIVPPNEIYNFDCDTVDALLWNEPYNDNEGVPEDDYHQTLQTEEEENEIHAMMKDIMLLKSEEEEEESQQRRYEPIKLHKFGLRRRTPIERQTRPPTIFPPNPSTSNNNTDSVMLQRRTS